MHRSPYRFGQRSRHAQVAKFCGILCGLLASALGFYGCLLGTDYRKVDAEACDTVTPGACALGGAVKFSGSEAAEVTDIAQLPGGSIVVVGRFRGVLTVAGQQLVATPNETDGFLVELSSSGSHLSHLLLPEVDETSDLQVAVDSTTTDVVVGGSYSQGPFGNCSSSHGLFARRLGYSMMDGYTSRYQGLELVCIDAAPGTTVKVNDVGVYPTNPFVQLSGAFEGALGGVTSNGIDGFAVAISPTGVPESPFVLGGAGEAVVRSAMPSLNQNEWLLVGDFSGSMQALVAAGKTVDTTAIGERDLFLLSFDGNPKNPNLSFTQLGAAGGEHHAVDLAFDFANTDNAVLLADLRGPIAANGQTFNAADEAATLALRFRVPVDSSGQTFAVQGHHLLRADTLLPLNIGGTPDRFYVAGHASGAIRVVRNDVAIGTIDAVGCQLDAFLMTLDGNALSQPQRCGDGQQQVAALSARMGGSATAIVLPQGAALDTGNGSEKVDSGSTSVVLLQ